MKTRRKNLKLELRIDIGRPFAKGMLNTLREAATRLREGGAIINLSTSVVGLKLVNYGIYAAIKAATKAAVETMTEIMAKELHRRDITVNVVAPGPAATALFLGGKPKEVVERMSKMTSLEQLGTPACGGIFDGLGWCLDQRTDIAG